ncbi:hypothetical protein AKJ09_06215 [Labilithrix luteola]|uniref:Cytochrome c domain-containing protein n=1 Tax=Labilithrix luteola TaxID=1391654 RepID=A0A0K1Q1N5_9BACT|nr:hypothetical protein [Labilithrix luteola]AKU99551.1 hypothetical protein AKJ09_06215 [Labilithrix luteola]
MRPSLRQVRHVHRFRQVDREGFAKRSLAPALALAFVVGVAAVAACSGADSPPPDATPTSTLIPEGPAGSGLNTKLPCDVQALLENRCIGCHSGNSPPPLLTYADLVAPSRSNPQKTMAQVAVERLRSATSPMPPPPAAPPAEDEIVAFENWVKAGTKSGTPCTPPVVDAGAPGTTNPTVPLVCTSGQMWTGQESDREPEMHPGGACNTCHQVKGGPNFRIAGTVYPTLHEPDDCMGVDPRGGPLVVIVTDARNRDFQIPVQEGGNFSLPLQIAPPFKARVRNFVSDKVREMKGSVTSGDCNACHTGQGKNGAPGRIMAP